MKNGKEVQPSEASDHGKPSGRWALRPKNFIEQDPAVDGLAKVETSEAQPQLLLGAKKQDFRY